jgi:hypothetical protein
LKGRHLSLGIAAALALLSSAAATQATTACAMKVEEMCVMIIRRVDVEFKLLLLLLPAVAVTTAYNC